MLGVQALQGRGESGGFDLSSGWRLVGLSMCAFLLQSDFEWPTQHSSLNLVCIRYLDLRWYLDYRCLMGFLKGRAFILLLLLDGRHPSLPAGAFVSFMLTVVVVLLLLRGVVLKGVLDVLGQKDVARLLAWGVGTSSLVEIDV